MCWTLCNCKTSKQTRHVFSCVCGIENRLCDSPVSQKEKYFQKKDLGSVFSTQLPWASSVMSYMFIGGCCRVATHSWSCRCLRTQRSATSFCFAGADQLLMLMLVVFFDIWTDSCRVVAGARTLWFSAQRVPLTVWLMVRRKWKLGTFCKPKPLTKVWWAGLAFLRVSPKNKTELNSCL